MLSELRGVAGFTAFVAVLTGLSALSMREAAMSNETVGSLTLFLAVLSIAVFILAWKAKREFDSHEKMDDEQRQAQRKIEEAERQRRHLSEHRANVLNQVLRRWLIAKLAGPVKIQLEILQFHPISPTRFIVAAVSIHATSSPDHFSSNSFFATIDINSLEVEDILFVDHGVAIFREPVFQAIRQNPSADLVEVIEAVYPLAEAVFLDIE